MLPLFLEPQSLRDTLMPFQSRPSTAGACHGAAGAARPRFPRQAAASSAQLWLCGSPGWSGSKGPVPHHAPRLVSAGPGNGGSSLGISVSLHLPPCTACI